MNIDEALKQLQDFINAYENEDIRSYVKQKYGDLGHTENDYKATKVLMEEVGRLKEENEQLRKQSFTGIELANIAIAIDRTKRENEQLKEALKKCIPFTDCSNKANNVCEFCYEKKHADDCEYKRLIGGNE